MEIKAFLEDKRDYLPEVKHLLFSANRRRRKKEIESMLENGTIIVMNRYWQSNLVYGVANGIETNWLLPLGKVLSKEDIGLGILVTPSISAKRGETKDMFESDPQL